MFKGYLTLGGVEIFNAARTKAYVDALLPGFGLSDVHESEDLPCIIGDEPYNAPWQDQAPWFSPTRAASGKFYGLYPLEVQGLDDSTRYVTSTELVTDGGIHSLARYTSKEFRVTGTLIAADKEGLEEGKDWLRGVLAGSDCLDGECEGEEACFLAFLPTCCDYSAYPVVPYSSDTSSGQGGGWAAYRDGALLPGAGLSVSMPSDDDGAQVHVAGLIPGQPYRLSVMISSADELTLEVAGIASVTAARGTSTALAPQTPWVLDFIAIDSTAAVRLTGPGSAVIFSTQVERTPAILMASQPRFTLDSTQEPGAWNLDEPDDFSGSSTALDVATETLRLRWTNTDASPHDLPAGTAALRLVRGLTPGRRYVAYAKVSLSDGSVPILSAGAADAISATLDGQWISVSFTATATQHYVSLSTPVDIPVGAGSTADLLLNYLRVDLDASALGEEEIDQAQFAVRSLYRVTAISGPSFVDKAKSVGAMASVAFTLSAGHPFVYGQIQPALLDPAAASSLVPQVDCVLGLPVRTNLFTSPTFAGAGGGETPFGGISTYAVVVFDSETINPAVAEDEVFDGFSMRLWVADDESPDGDETFVEIPTTGLLAGHTYTISADVGIEAPQPGAQSEYARRIVVSDGSGIHASNAHPNVAGSTRVSITFTLTGDLNYIRLYHGGIYGDNNVYWTNVLVEESPVAGSFFDGDSDGAAWSGDEGESTSTWTTPDSAVIEDPDCPVVPLPPAVPTIENACPPDVEVWRRYFVPIPSSQGGGWNESVPIVKMTTGATAVRDVRVRFYANPFSRPVEQLNPCDYCGEFFVSYIPERTTMVIDGILTRVDADVAGTGSQNAMNLVSAFDGGPIEWPSMTCDTPYVMTVDIAPDEVLDFDVRLSVARRR